MDSQASNVVSWRKLSARKKFGRKPEPDMVLPDGVIQRSTVDREKKNIHFDRDYVLTYIEKSVISPLAKLGKDKVFELFEEAWDYGTLSTDEDND